MAGGEAWDAFNKEPVRLIRTRSSGDENSGSLHQFGIGGDPSEIGQTFLDPSIECHLLFARHGDHFRNGGGLEAFASAAIRKHSHYS